MKIRKSAQSFMNDAYTIDRKILRTDCIEYADMLFGVGSATSAGPSLPSGSVHPSPETLEKDNGAYARPIVNRTAGDIRNSGRQRH